MGAYINLGFISNKDKFIDKIIHFINTLNEFHVISFKYPTDENYSSWIECENRNCAIYEALKHCYKYHMAEIKCNFKIQDFSLHNILLRIKHIGITKECLLFEIPEENPIFKNLDVAENTIILFLKCLSNMKFESAFCDIDADILENDSEYMENFYSIFIKYEMKTKVYLNQWKIDGLTDRT